MKGIKRPTVMLELFFHKDGMVKQGDAAQKMPFRYLVIVGENLVGDKGVDDPKHGVLHGARCIEMPSVTYGILYGECGVRGVWLQDSIKFAFGK